MSRSTPAALAVTGFLVLSGSGAMAQSFTCNFGKQPACLDYSDKVCSSFSKCVSDNAICFESYTCDYQGFTCKSNLVDLAGEYDGLADDYNELLRKAKSLESDFDNLLRKSRSLATDYDDLSDQFETAQNCVEYADTIEEAQGCF